MWVLAWIEEAPKAAGGCGCFTALIIMVVVGTIFFESLLHKDLDKDGKIAYTWTEEVINSEGLKPNIDYYGETKLRRTMSDKLVDTIIWNLKMNEDNSFRAYWKEKKYMFNLQDEFSLDGEWDYYVIDGSVYRLLMFESNTYAIPDFLVDEHLKVYIRDESGDIGSCVGHFQVLRP